MPRTALESTAPRVEGTLMSVDIEDVQVGDIVFLGGHLIRRAGTRPADKTYRHGNAEYRVWTAQRLEDPADPAFGSEFNTLAGTSLLIVRPTA